MLIDSFLDYLRFEKNYSEKTVVNYGIDLKQFEEFFKSVEEEIDFQSVDADMIRNWMLCLMEKNYTSASVNRKFSSLRSFYRFLLRRGVVVLDPVRKVMGPKSKKTLPSFLKESEMDKLLDETNFGESFKGCRDKAIIEMFYATGIRLSELVGLNDVDVDLSAMQIKVTGKRNKQRIIPFGEEMKETLYFYINVRDSVVSGKSEAFFVKEDGSRLRNALVCSIVKRNLSKVVSLKKKSPHVLRHTFATIMLNHEANLEAVKELLGHESIATTEIYTHTTFEELKKVYKQAHPRA